MRALPGWAALSRWRFACAVTGGALLAANATSPFLIIGRRRLAALVARDVRRAIAAGTLTAPAGQARSTPAAVTGLAEATANVLREAGHEA